MARVREKISTFFFGLTVGLLIGCAIFIFKLDDYVKNFRFSNVNKPEFEETTKLNEEPKNKKDLKKKQVTAVQTQKNEKERKTDSLIAADEKEIAMNDSLIADYTSENENNENISVLKEELVGVKNVKVKAQKENGNREKDSLAGSVAGVNEPATAEFMVIEFWKTPLNSKGYKMSRNKILLYGVPEQNVDIVKMDDSYYLKNNNLVYRLSYSNEFRKMEKVNESSILARIN